MSKLLYLVHRVPFPPNRGDRIRSYHLLKQLVKSHQVDLATLCDEPVEDATLAELRKLCGRVEIAPLMGKGRWMRAAKSVLTGHSATEGLFYSRQLHDTVRTWSADTRYDGAVVFCSSMLPYLDAPGLKDVPAIVDLVDVDSQKWFDYAAQSGGIKRSLFRLEGRRLRQLERRCVNRAEAVTLVSDTEAALFRKVCPNDKTVGVSNGVDLEYFRPNPAGPRPWSALPVADRCHLVFVGALDYRANVDGVRWFATQVWPLVREKLPHLTLSLVGRKPTPEVKALENVPGIRVFGSVPDVRPYVAAADIVIAPLRVARGIQNKVLEAMAMGKVVLASPQALEGLDVQDGWDVVSATTPERWLTQIQFLTGDPALRGQIQSEARRVVEARYGWAVKLRKFDELTCFEPRLLAAPSAAPRSALTPQAAG